MNIRNEANRRSDFKGIIPKEAFNRFPQDTINSINSDAQVEFSSLFDYSKTPIIKGTATLNVTSTCMRCMEEFSYDVIANFIISPVSSEEQADNLPPEYSPLPINEFGEVNIYEGIEEELIMSIALTPKHENENCNPILEEYSTLEDDEEVQDQIDLANNPFASLNALKGKLKEK
ncbi:YceD family protein [Psittacicella hinzii]|uniref:YceD family protein n=1 Tax=Psittacicella hinzii TaxID=2028575 RepID=UPI001CA798BC|nr:YceD family protein [Psittacicella hinzii]